MGGILSIVIFILDIIAIVEIVKSKADSGKKILWALLVILLPVVGLVLYYLIGKKQF